MSDKQEKTPPTKPSPGVEPDEMPTGILARQLVLIGVGVVVISLGLWRLLIHQTRQEAARGESSDANSEALLLRAENEGKLDAPAHRDLQSQRYRIPIREALRRVARDPRLLRPLMPPLPRPAPPDMRPAPEGATMTPTPPMAPAALPMGPRPRRRAAPGMPAPRTMTSRPVARPGATR